MAKLIFFDGYKETLTFLNAGKYPAEVYLTNIDPNASNHRVKSHLPEIPTGNGYKAKKVWITIIRIGDYDYLSLNHDVIWTASGGGIRPFRYVVLHKGTQLIGWWDFKCPVILDHRWGGSTFTIDTNLRLQA